MFKRIDHVEIVPSNLKRTLDFYTEILGFKVHERRRLEGSPIEEIVFIKLNDTMIELLAAKNPAPVSSEPYRVGYQRVALEVEDMDRAIAYLKSKGIEIVRGPVTIGTAKRAEIKDPDGLSIELRQW